MNQQTVRIVRLTILAVAWCLTMIGRGLAADYWATLDEYDRPLPTSGYVYHRTGGDRGLMNVGDASFAWDGNSAYTVTIAQQPGSWNWGGMTYSLIHPKNDHQPLNFGAIFGPYVLPAYQARITAVEIGIRGVTSPTQNPGMILKLEFKNTADQIIQAPTLDNLASRAYPYTWTIPVDGVVLGNVQSLNWVFDNAKLNDSITIDRVRLRVTAPDLSTSNEAFLWSYAWLINNYLPSTGMVQDRSNFGASDMENVSATGKAAKVVAYASLKGITSSSDARVIITKMADTLLTKVPRGPAGINALWPHFTKTGGTVRIADSEWASGDTAYAALDLMAALQMIGDPSNQMPALQNFIEGINWDALRALTLDHTISHGYKGNGSPISNGWDAFGMETVGVNWAYASATGQRTLMLPPPSYNGSGFIDEAQYPLVLSGVDAWGNDWDAYRQGQASAQLQWYTPAKNPFIASAKLFGLSAGEIPEADNPSLPNDQKYAAYGIGGIAAAEDGGGEVVTLHYSGMIAGQRPVESAAMWESLRTTGELSPLNAVESLRVKAVSGLKTLNALKGSWNLALQAEGWALADPAVKAALQQAVQDNAFLRKGAQVLLTPPVPFVSVSSAAFSFSTPFGGATPPAQMLIITNTGSTGSTLNWTITTSQPWLSATPGAGSTAQGGPGSGVILSVNTAGLSIGTYNAALTLLDSRASNNPQVIPVTLTVLPSPSTLAYVQGAGTSQSTAGGTLSQSFHLNNTSGNLIVVGVSWNTSASPLVTVTDSQGNSYNQATQTVDPAHQQALAIYYAANIKNGANTVTAAFGASAANRRLIVHEYQGATTLDPLFVTATNIDNVGSTAVDGVTSTSTQTTIVPALAFGVVTDDGGISPIAAGTGFQLRQSVANEIASEDKVQTSPGLATATFTFGTAHSYLAHVAVFKGAVPTLPCDINGDGRLNVIDVQLCVNQVIGVAPCTNADINHDGVCNVLDVQKLVNGVLGFICQ